MKKLLPVILSLILAASLISCRTQAPDGTVVTSAKVADVSDTVVVPETTSGQSTASETLTSATSATAITSEEVPATTTGHVHAFGAWNTITAATCETNGEQRRVCACGAEEFRWVYPSGHNMVGGVCANCGARETVGLTFTLNEDGQSYTVTKGEDTSGSIIIPSSYNGKPVIAIGAFGFEKCTWLTALTIPDSVTDIGRYAFEGCKNLGTVLFGKNVKVIGGFAFDSCRELSSVTLFDGVEEIGEYAFSACRFLDNITLPDSIRSIGFGAFSDIAYVKSDNHYVSGVLYIGNHLITANVSGYYNIRPGTKTIAAGAFAYNRGLCSLTLPADIAGIGENAFEACSNLTLIRFDGTVAQWEAMMAQTGGGNGAPKMCTIRCTDGDTTNS